MNIIEIFAYIFGFVLLIGFLTWLYQHLSKKRWKLTGHTKLAVYRHDRGSRNGELYVMFKTKDGSLSYIEVHDDKDIYRTLKVYTDKRGQTYRSCLLDEYTDKKNPNLKYYEIVGGNK